MVHDDPVDVPIAQRCVGAAGGRGCRQHRAQLSCGPENYHVQCLANDTGIQLRQEMGA